jgi:hypothetical protein
MAGFVQDLLKDAAKGFFGSDYLRDYTHASKTFRSNTYENAPKLKFNFHVYFDINPEAYTRPNANFSLLVKSVKLPSFTFATHEMNQYNRKRIVQTKVKYDPIDVRFHDDNGNLINSLWYKYFTYYYKDAENPNVIFAGSRGGRAPNNTSGNSGAATSADYNSKTTYTPSITGYSDWGFIGESSQPSGPDPKKIPFFKNITVFGMNRHNFIAYTLINPIITRFNHDTYSYSENGGIMENGMTIDYETVVYNQGAIDGRTPDNIVTGFGTNDYYDRTVSPIAIPGSNGSILGQNGLVDGVGGAFTQLSDGNFAAAAKIAGTAYNTFKNINLKDTIKAEVKNAIGGALLNTANPTRSVQWDIPNYGATPSNKGTAGAPSTGTVSPQQQGPNPNAGSQVAGG